MSGVLVLLLPLGVLLLMLAVGLFTFGAWLKALLYALEAKFVAAGWWLCVGIFMLNAINAVANNQAWHDLMPLYIAIMIVGAGGAVLKQVLTLRREC